MPKCVTRSVLLDFSKLDCPLYRALDRFLIRMVSLNFPGVRTRRSARGGKNVLPAPFMPSLGIFSGKRMRQRDAATVAIYVFLIDCFDAD